MSDFIRGQEDPLLWRPKVLAIADDIEKIGKTLDDKRIRELQRLRSLQVTLQDIGNACLQE